MTGKKDDVKADIPENKIFSKEDFGEIAKLGGQILKKTVVTGMDVFKEAGISREATTQFISNRKDDLLRGMPKEVLQSIFNSGVDRAFELLRNHKIELTIKLKKDSDEKDISEKSKKQSKKKS